MFTEKKTIKLMEIKNQQIKRNTTSQEDYFKDSV